MNNPESKISKYMKNERNYHLLEELHTLPSVGYLTKIRNKKA
jgi:molybdopterin-containing oxidoreductase family iron-sulfur binding subunit